MAVLTDVTARGAIIVDEQGRATELLYLWMALITQLLEQGYTGTVTTAALTGGGVQGSMTFQNGVLISQTQAT